MIKHFINLTNGIEYIPFIKEDFSFIRIQSTSCEQKRWDDIIQTLDANFLMNLAIGNTCIVYDMGVRSTVPRALYQGLSFIKFVLSKNWLNLELKSIVKGHDSTEYFRQVYRTLDPKTRSKLEYYRKFVITDLVRIEYVCVGTTHDGDNDFYAKIISDFVSK